MIVLFEKNRRSELESKLEEMRKVSGDTLDSDEIFADAVDYRRRTVVENRPDSVEIETPINNPAEDDKSTTD